MTVRGAVDAASRSSPARRLGDRRRGQRLEVIGTLWGVLEVTEPATVLDISGGGALLGLRAPVLPGRTLPVLLKVNGAAVSIPSIVRHTATHGLGADGMAHRAGVEFMTPYPFGPE